MLSRKRAMNRFYNAKEYITSGGNWMVVDYLFTCLHQINSFKSSSQRQLFEVGVGFVYSQLILESWHNLYLGLSSWKPRPNHSRSKIGPSQAHVPAKQNLNPADTWGQSFGQSGLFHSSSHYPLSSNCMGQSAIEMLGVPNQQAQIDQFKTQALTEIPAQAGLDFSISSFYSLLARPLDLDIRSKT